MDKIICKPFLKWVGGKSQLLPEISSRIPHNFARYFEPFIGGGAVFFYLQPTTAYISDINPELINVYLVIKNNINELLNDLKKHIYNQDYYYNIRNIDRSESYYLWSDVEKASRFIYLNKACYNGLYRVNSKGQFNVPFGKYVNPKIVDEDNLKACHQVLQSATIATGSFLQIEEIVTKHDFIYFDPPYFPLNPTSNFTSYTQMGFNEAMQIELKEMCDRLTKKGIRFMHSNSSAPFILDLYKNYNIDLVYASRAINSKAQKRGKIAEVIISNYK